MSLDQQLRKKALDHVNKLGTIVEKDPYYPKYHIAPPVGLLNDPNGWIQWNGTYHLFYQWMPFKTGHGAKFWGHVSSKDLIHWKDEPIALTPGDWFDKDGCYSGSAISFRDELLLYYTGNVKHNNIREAYQCLAVSKDGKHFEKKGVQIEVPKGYTAHFRDPKVWQEDDQFYMVIGAQTEKEEGSVVWFSSRDLMEWRFGGTLASGFGYMWECPDFFTIDGTDILLFSPQGLSASGIHYRNTHQTGYIAGKWDKKANSFTHGQFIELDKGFEFYAPQTTIDNLGRRLLFGWMGVPDQDEQLQPTVKNGWLHQLTVPRELAFRDGQIFQKPVEELKQLRKQQLYQLELEKQSVITRDIPKASELKLEVQTHYDIEIQLFGYLTLSYNAQTQHIRLVRPKLDGSGSEERAAVAKEIKEIRCLIDHSSVEIFINDGEIVFTSRMFANPSINSIDIKAIGKLTVWELAL
ncbi:beta-fructofuranosidase [Gracilibacillus ureilyticus]|uniref:Sucrose-6-phosphate hydrolase n=1 Tax=Gracilibacillus ureilyticus TaxID=531814 RepID=A0A1H9USD7_9BACI|nr:sucrose-6-phosphate hydrolase [Gracilibacillus ureilyticus]SES12044.1 beta-fructofuranosidase [Gracilibacillus ureilyticus]